LEDQRSDLGTGGSSTSSNNCFMGGYAAPEERYEEDREPGKEQVDKEKKKEESEEKETTSYLVNTEEGPQYSNDSIDVSCYRSYIFEDEDAEQSGTQEYQGITGWGLGGLYVGFGKL